jgi:hypothetical protein
LTFRRTKLRLHAIAAHDFLHDLGIRSGRLSPRRVR